MNLLTKYPSKKRKVVNERYRKLVHFYFTTNFDKCEAMRMAGYKGKVKGYSDKTFKHPFVMAEIERQRKKMTDKFELTRDWIVERLMMLADSGVVLAKFKKIDDDGNLYWDFTGATPEELKIIHGISTDKYAEGRGPNKRDVKKFSVTTSDPKAALDSLARIQGLFNDKVTVNGEVSIIDRLNRGRQRVKADE